MRQDVGAKVWPDRKKSEERRREKYRWLATERVAPRAGWLWYRQRSSLPLLPRCVRDQVASIAVPRASVAHRGVQVLGRYGRLALDGSIIAWAQAGSLRDSSCESEHVQGFHRQLRGGRGRAGAIPD